MVPIVNYLKRVDPTHWAELRYPLIISMNLFLKLDNWD